jgi:hypothetical protein
MRIIETKAYLYSELSDAAKQKARDWYTGEGFEFDADGSIEDVKQIADIIGVDDCKVLYRGFWSQGDGACINGRYSYSKGALKRIKEYTPLDTVLHDIVKRLQDAQRKGFYKTTCKIAHSGGYCHYNSMDFSFDNELWDNLDDRGASYQAIVECFKDFAKWIYRNLEKDYEYQTSKEVVEDRIIANECEFTEGGKIV